MTAKSLFALTLLAVIPSCCMRKSEKSPKPAKARAMHATPAARMTKQMPMHSKPMMDQMMDEQMPMDSMDDAMDNMQNMEIDMEMDEEMTPDMLSDEMDE